MSNYIVAEPLGFDGEAQHEPQWVPCKRCYETGEDDDGADCIFCAGMGAVQLR